MRRFHFNERPDSFEIDPQHQYAQQLVFAGLGRFSGGLHYHDSSLYGNHGVLTNMTPASDWVRDLGRWGVYRTGNTEHVYWSSLYDVQSVANSPFTACLWIKPTAWITLSQSVVSVGSLDYKSLTLGVVGTGPSTGKLMVVADTDGSSPWDILPTAFGGSTAMSGDAIPLNAWSHIGWSRDINGVYTYFVNGAANGTFTNANDPVLNSQVVKLGAHYRFGVTYSPSAYLSDFCLYARVLSPSEITHLADPTNVMYSLGGSDSGLLRYRRKWWPVVSGAAVGKYWLWARRNSQVIGSGLGV